MRVVQCAGLCSIDVYPWDDSHARVEINNFGEAYINWRSDRPDDPALVIKKLETIIEAVKIGVDAHNKRKREVGR